MEREQQPIVVVDESRFDFVLHLVGLTVELRAVVGDFDRLTVFVRTLVSDFSGLRLPLPFVAGFEQSGNVYIPCVADRFNLVVRIKAIRFGNFFDNGIALLRPAVCSDEKHCKSQNTDGRCTVWHGITPRLDPTNTSEMMRNAQRYINSYRARYTSHGPVR